jgi:hypothetical protein
LLNQSLDNNARRFRRCNTFAASAFAGVLLGFKRFHKVGGTNVDLTLRLNVLVVCVVFLFVGAILFGAF